MNSQTNKIPLHKLITAYILEKKRVHAGELETFVKSMGAEAYTGRRRAQELTQPTHRNFNPNIKKIYEKGCVIYLWQETPQGVANFAPRTIVHQKTFCCFDYWKRNVHSPNCFKLKEKLKTNQQQLL